MRHDGLFWGKSMLSQNKNKLMKDINPTSFTEYYISLISQHYGCATVKYVLFK
jgi:hypothetical protein